MTDAVDTRKKASAASICGSDDQENYTVDDSQGVLLVRFKKGAAISSKDIYRALRCATAIDDGRFLNDLWDLRGASMDPDVGFRHTANMVRDLVDWIGDRCRAKTAIVADNSEVFGVMRMYQTMASDLPFEVALFENPQDALAWLLS